MPSPIKETDHKKERTLVIVKPDGVQRGLTGEVIKRFERVGLKLVALKLLTPTEEMVRAHYTSDPEWLMRTGTKSLDAFKAKGLPLPIDNPIDRANNILNDLANYLTCGPSVVMVWQGAYAAKIVRKLTGATEPFASDVGTIRGDFVMDSYEMAEAQERSVRNVIHASGSSAEAEAEIKAWFKPHEIIEYKSIQEQILYEDFTHLLGN